MDNRFTDIIKLIKQSRTNAVRAVNSELINMYWNIGEYVFKKIEQSEWGDSVVTELANFIQKNEPEIKGLLRQEHLENEAVFMRLTRTFQNSQHY